MLEQVSPLFQMMFIEITNMYIILMQLKTAIDYNLLKNETTKRSERSGLKTNKTIF